MAARHSTKPDVITPRTLHSIPSHASSPRLAWNIHPEFASPDADVVLRSEEGTLFFVHSHTLHEASGLFRTMFTLPQPIHDVTNQNKPIEIPIYETDAITAPLLRLLRGFPTPSWHSFDTIERVLFVAEKWDTPGPIAHIRDALMSPRFLNSDPLRLYTLAKHFGWRKEAKIAATLTLGLDLNDGRYTETLNRLTTRELMPLLKLRRDRSERFRELLNSPGRFAAGNSTLYHCSQCGVTKIDNQPWRELKHAMFVEMDRRPLGDTIGRAGGESEEWPEAKACWAATCPKDGCQGLNYDRISTLRQIRHCIDSLPMTIDDDT